MTGWGRGVLATARGRIALALVVVVAAGAIVVARPPQEAQAATAHLSVLSPGLTVQRAGSAAQEVFDGHSLRAGDVLTAAGDARGVITIFETTTVVLEPGAVIQIFELSARPDATFAIVIIQTAGTLWTAVAAAPDKRTTFEVRLGDTVAVAGAGGTFSTTVQAGAAVISVDGGSVEARKGEAKAVVQPGFVLTARPQEKELPRPVPAPDRANGLHLLVDPGTVAVLSSPFGHVCAVTAAGAPGCVVEPAHLQVRQPYEGTWSLTLRPRDAAGRVGATLRTIGSRCDTGCAAGEAAEFGLIGSNLGLSDTAARGEELRWRIGVRKEPGAGWAIHYIDLFSADPDRLGGSACTAEMTGKLFTTGTLGDRMGALTAYASRTAGQPFGLLVTQDDVMAAASAALAGQPVQVVGARIAPPSSFTVDGKVGDVPAKLLITLSTQKEQLVTAARVENVPDALTDVFRGQLEQLFGGVKAVPARWQRAIWGDGCVALTGVTRSASPELVPPEVPALKIGGLPSAAGVWISVTKAAYSPADDRSVTFTVHGCPPGSSVSVTRVHPSGEAPRSVSVAVPVTGAGATFQVALDQIGAGGLVFLDLDACGRKVQVGAYLAR